MRGAEALQNVIQYSYIKNRQNDLRSPKTKLITNPKDDNLKFKIEFATVEEFINAKGLD